MPSEWQDMTRGLLHTPPMVWHEREMLLRHVSSVREIKRLEAFLDKAKKWLSLLEKITPPCSSWAKSINWISTNYDNDAGFTWNAALATVFANCITGEGPFMLPLSVQQVKEVADMLAMTLESSKGRENIKDAFYKCMKQVLSESGMATEELSPMFHNALEPFVREVCSLSRKSHTAKAGDIPGETVYSRNILIEREGTDNEDGVKD
jgi:hypothetical protein